MKTFEEAVRAALTTKTNSAESIAAIADRQTAFLPEIQEDPVLAIAVSSSVNNYIDAIQRLEGDDQGEQVILITASTLYSAFAWGLAVGREMEKVEF